MQSVNDMEHKDVRLIAVMGNTGVGKTTFINQASGSDLPVGYGLSSCSLGMQLSDVFALDGHQVALIDAPGFDDSFRSENEILQLIADFLVTIYLSGKKLNGIIFLHRITDDRMGGAAIKSFRLFRHMCGEYSLRNVIIATNRWSTVQQELGERRERELGSHERMFKPAMYSGAQLLRHYDTAESAHTIIRQLLFLPPVTLRIQEEMVDERKSLCQTGAGKELDRHFEHLAQKLYADEDTLLRDIQALDNEYTKRNIQKDATKVIVKQGGMEVDAEATTRLGSVWMERTEGQNESLGASHAADDHTEDLKDMKEELDQTRERLKRLENERNTLKHTQSNHEERLKEIEEVIRFIENNRDWKEQIQGSRNPNLSLIDTILEIILKLPWEKIMYQWFERL